MRELIRNERRIELCFENFRFWDLRRWNVDLTKLNETALGVEISKNGSVMNYSLLTVEKRKYEESMDTGLQNRLKCHPHNQEIHYLDFHRMLSSMKQRLQLTWQILI